MAQISLYNDRWNNGVTVDVNVGRFQDCNQNARIKTQVRVGFQTSLDIDAGGQTLCYRRDKDPDNPNGQMDVWVRVEDFGQPQTVNI